MTVGQGDCITASLAFDERKPQVRHEVLFPLSRQEKGVWPWVRPLSPAWWR